MNKLTRKILGITAALMMVLTVCLNSSMTAHALTPLTAENFDAVRYADTYADLKAAYGYDAAQLWNHYINHGTYEGRTAYALNGDYGYLSMGSADNLGIDVSSYQGIIDWYAVKNAGIDYAVIRLGYRGSTEGGLYTDKYFYRNIQGAQAAGIRVGVYFVTQAVNEAEAVEEANYCINVLSGYALQLPVFLDVEGSGGRGDTIGREMRTNVCVSFCQTMIAAGRAVGIYSNKTWFDNRMDVSRLTPYFIWLAQYRSEKTYNSTRVDMWQYTESGSVPGIAGSVDMNRIYVGW